MFAAGWLTLLAGSVIAGAAGNVATELIGRAVQGGGAALITPSAPTLLMMLFGSSTQELTKALAAYVQVGEVGGAQRDQVAVGAEVGPAGR